MQKDSKADRLKNAGKIIRLVRQVYSDLFKRSEGEYNTAFASRSFSVACLTLFVCFFGLLLPYLGDVFSLSLSLLKFAFLVAYHPTIGRHTLRVQKLFGKDKKLLLSMRYREFLSLSAQISKEINTGMCSHFCCM
jgi:hypothetical protein